MQSKRIALKIGRFVGKIFIVLGLFFCAMLIMKFLGYYEWTRNLTTFLKEWPSLVFINMAISMFGPVYVLNRIKLHRYLYIPYYILWGTLVLFAFTLMIYCVPAPEVY